MTAEPARLAPWWEGALVLAASWALSLGRPATYHFSGDATTFLGDAAAFPIDATLWDLCYPTPAALFHGPLTGLCLVPITRLPVETLAHLMIWAGLVGLSPLILWWGLRRELPRAALPVALGLIVNPAFSLGIRHFSSPGVLPLFLALAIGPMLAGHRKGSWLALLAAGAAAGLATGSHLAGVLLAPALLAATWPWRRNPRAWLGVTAFAVLTTAALLPPFLLKPRVLYVLDVGVGSPQLMNYTLVLILGGLLPAVAAIALMRSRSLARNRTRPRWRTLLVSPAWWLLGTGAALAVYLSIPTNYLYPHYFDVAIVGLLLVLAPATRLERGVLLGVFGLCLAVQLGMIAMMPLDEPFRWRSTVARSEAMCRGELELPDPEKADPRPFLYLMRERCPERVPEWYR